MSSMTTRNADRSLFRRLQDHAISGRERGRQLPGRHQDGGSSAWNDLPDDPERLMEVVGHRIAVDFAQAAFLRRQDATGEIAEMIDGQRKIRRRESRARVCRCPRFPRPPAAISRLASRRSAILFRMFARSVTGGFAPRRFRAVGRRPTPFRISSALAGAGDIAKRLAWSPGEMFWKYWFLAGGVHSPPMKFP